jgi:hypothetical protein
MLVPVHLPDDQIPRPPNGRRIPDDPLTLFAGDDDLQTTLKTKRVPLPSPCVDDCPATTIFLLQRLQQVLRGLRPNDPDAKRELLVALRPTAVVPAIIDDCPPTATIFLLQRLQQVLRSLRRNDPDAKQDLLVSVPPTTVVPAIDDSPAATIFLLQRLQQLLRSLRRNDPGVKRNLLSCLPLESWMMKVPCRQALVGMGNEVRDTCALRLSTRRHGPVAAANKHPVAPRNKSNPGRPWNGSNDSNRVAYYYSMIEEFQKIFWNSELDRYVYGSKVVNSMSSVPQSCQLKGRQQLVSRANQNGSKWCYGPCYGIKISPKLEYQE